jgi:hypothetical protein
VYRALGVGPFIDSCLSLGKDLKSIKIAAWSGLCRGLVEVIDHEPLHVGFEGCWRQLFQPIRQLTV